ncbi:hypothetical protein ACHAW5_005265 [Stephanodiscus triporus]|uniref:Cyclin N-terminal domain-containing protein n=1 Tax=Stephanodiscus triporus TaxID=2934178 RepID=A0ABD3P871_9STRA
MPLLIGPSAALPRCRRDAKVASTACLLFRRFYLSNSVMMHDPRTMLAASAFLASKVEDCTISISCIESGTEEMNARVRARDVLDAEVRLIRGIDFDLLVFSPYKTVLSFTEDMRTFLRTERGAGLVRWPSRRGRGRVGGRRGLAELAGEDLRPMHDEAMRICDDMIRELREGKHGCGNYELDMDELKGLNKKLKKCRAWGLSDKKEKKEKKKKKKKRKAEDS